MSAKIAKQRLIAVLAEDHAERGTRPITARDFAVRALEMFVETTVTDRLFGRTRSAEVTEHGGVIKFAERFRQ